MRLLARVYADAPMPSKVSLPNDVESIDKKLTFLQWWLSFTKRKFMGKSL